MKNKFLIVSSLLVILFIAPFSFSDRTDSIEPLPLDASTENVEQWDSLAYLSIVSKLEKEFELKINQENINKFNSLENIVKEIEICVKKNLSRLFY